MLINFIAILFFISHSILAQGIVGKIFTKTEANNLFGQVNASSTISSTLLSNIIDQSNNYILFRLENNQLFIADNSRHPLFPENFNIKPETIFHLFSISKVAELIAIGISENTYVELRNKDILTITSGNFTLEVSDICPPYCY